jgi:hypothetical protein
MDSTIVLPLGWCRYTHQPKGFIIVNRSTSPRQVPMYSAAVAWARPRGVFCAQPSSKGLAPPWMEDVVPHYYYYYYSHIFDIKEAPLDGDDEGGI